MKKEPIGLYIFRFVLGFGLFAFMIMLYWSSVLLEKDMIEVKEMLQRIRIEVGDLESDLEKIGLKEQLSLSFPKNSESQITVQKQIDPNLPNLLDEDPFYEKTLPELLGPDFIPNGILKEATIGKPDNLHPFSNWASVSGWNSQCTVTVAQQHVGVYETMAPNMGLKMEERRSNPEAPPEYWVHLRDDVYWFPLKPSFFSNDIELASQFLNKQRVTAHDFKFYFDALMNPFVSQAGAVALRNYFQDIEKFEVIDDDTFVVRWKSKWIKDKEGQEILKPKYVAKQLTGSLRPLPRFIYQYYPDGSKIIEDDIDPEIYRLNAVWAQIFNEHWAKNIIVSCGPYLFDGMSDQQIRFVRNPEFYQPLAALVEGMDITFKESTDSSWQDFKLGKIDTYTIQPDQLMELQSFLDSDVYQNQEEQETGIKRLDYLARTYSYIGWNQAKPYFKSKRVRQALTMSIDRERIINQNLQGLGMILSQPFFPYSSAYDPDIEPWPFDPYRAQRYLNQEEWYDSQGDGILDKKMGQNRIPFDFTLTYYVKNQTTKSIADYVSTALNNLGINCRLHGVDIADLSAVFDDKSFDALMLGWALGTPPEDPRQLWYSKGADEKGSSNAIGFRNQEVDEIIEKLEYEYDQEERVNLYHRFDAIIHEEAPYTFLYTPKVIFLYREYIQNVFLPIERQDLIPGADGAEPVSSIFWIKKRESP